MQNVYLSLKCRKREDNALADLIVQTTPAEEVQSNATMTELSSVLKWDVEQTNDDELSTVRRLIEANDKRLSSWSREKVDKWFNERSNLFIIDNELQATKNRRVVPRHLREAILKQFYDSPLAGHRAIRTTTEAIGKRFLWPNMAKEIEEYCLSCDKCQRYYFSLINNRGPLKSIVSQAPLDIVGIDVAGPFNRSRCGNRYLIVAIDHFTKWVTLKTVKEATAVETAKFIFDDLICIHGPIKRILTNKGTNFESVLVAQLCTLLKTQKLHSSPYHPEGDGVTERAICSLKPSIAKYVNDQHDNWDSFVQLIASAYNNAYHSTIGMSPYKAFFGRKPVQVADIILNSIISNDKRVERLRQ